MFEAIGGFFLALFFPLELGVAWVMVQFHALLTAAGMEAASGWTWSLSIVGLVIVLRILLIPLFFKQIKASRGMQLLQPEMRKIQQKYKGKTDPDSRQAMSRETMELYKAHGTNPFSSCLPALLQAPFFFALFRVLNNRIANNGGGVGVLDGRLAEQAAQSTLFGAQLTDTFLYTSGFAAKAVTLTLIIVMSVSMFLTQRQLMMKNMPASALDNPFAQQQKILMYAFPIIFLVTGVNFPLGVLVYWTTTNLWTGAQQFYVIRRMPAPGSLAEKALAERRARKGKKGPEPEVGGRGGVVAPPASGAEGPRPGGQGGQRQQPKRSKRSPSGQQPSKPRAPGSAPGARPSSARPPGARSTSTQPPGARQPTARPPGGGSRRGPQPEPGS